MRYPSIEIMTGVSLYILASFWSASPALCIASILMTCASIVILFSDLRYQIIPDSMLVVILVGLVGFFLFTHSSLRVALEHVLVGVLSFVFFFIIWFVTKGKGMGFGDVKLAGIMGIILGFPHVVMAFYIAFITGACVSVVLLVTSNKTLKSKVPFGPFLLFGLCTGIVFASRLEEFWHLWVG